MKEGQEPAFPNYPSNYPTPYQGITIRDYFAAAALQSMLASPNLAIGDITEFAKSAFEFADAMLKVREK